MRYIVPALLTGALFSGYIGGAHAQLADSENSARWVAAMIAADGNGSTEEYLDYAERLTKTMSQYSASVQKEIFGFLPPSDGGGTNPGSKGAGPSSVGATTPGAALADPGLSSGELFDILLQNSPLSDQDLLKVLERKPEMEQEHRADILKAQGKISNGTLVSALASAKLALPAGELKALLVSQSPLHKAVLQVIADTANLSSDEIAEVLAVQ